MGHRGLLLGGGIAALPLVITSFVGAFAGLGAKPSRRQKTSSWLLLLGGAQVLSSVIWNVTSSLWSADSVDEFVGHMIFGMVLIGPPGVLAMAAGVLLRLRQPLGPFEGGLASEAKASRGVG